MSGRVHWLEINTQRIKEAEAFYSNAFLWKVRALHFEPFGLMPMFSNEDVEFAIGFMAMGAFAPPVWHLYFDGNVDLAVSRASSLGGRVVEKANDHKGWSRNATFEDPEGAGFRVIQLENPPEGNLIPNGSPYCAELWAKDAKKMSTFYSELLDLPSKKSRRGWKVGDHLFIRDNPYRRPEMPWIPYFKSAGLGADQRRVEMFGAIPQAPRENVKGMGELAIYADPCGAFFGLVEP